MNLTAGQFSPHSTPINKTARMEAPLTDERTGGTFCGGQGGDVARCSSIAP
jgi:hypothetical protein